MTTFRRIALAAAALALLALTGCSGGGGSDEAKDEVWLIGLDGADWDLLDPMIERGELPNLAALREGGASGVLRSEEPLLSPILWTTIATGRSADVHGVTWFMTDAPDGTKVPVGTFDRRVHAFWNVADEAGLSCGIVGWWGSWPAEHLDGFVVTDFVGWHSFGVTGRETTEIGKVWPPELMDTVHDVLPHPDDVPMDLVERMIHRPRGELAGDASAGAYSDNVTHLRQSIATTRGYTDIVLSRLDEIRPDLLAVYYEGTDAVMHLFGDAMEPRLPWVPVDEFEADKDAVHEFWKWQDELLGELLAKRGPRTTVVVVSDHGFRMGDERLKEEHFSIETADADHMIDGVVIVNGPGVTPGARIADADIYDVAPTLLHLLGLPVARDLDGRVLMEVFDADSPRAVPSAVVASYENRPLRRPTAVDADAAAGEAMEQMLRSLGYIASGGDGHDHGAEAPTSAAEPGEHTAEQAVNLATILMRQGRIDEAVAELEGVLADDPTNPEARLNLAQALARRGDVDEAETIYRALIAEQPDRLEIREDLGLALGRAGRAEEALAVYDAGLVIDPDWVAGLAGRGHSLALTDRPVPAERALTRALELDPRHHDALFYLGQLQADAGHPEAAATLGRAHDLEPGDAATGVRLAGVHIAAGRPDLALSVLTRVRDAGAEDPDVFAELGAAQLMVGDAAAAERSLQTALQARPDDPDLLGNMGMAQAMTGRLPEAASTFVRVVELAPSPESHAQLGAFYAQLGRPADAERELRAAIALDPANPGANLHLGMLFHQTGRLDEARDAYQAAVDADPQLAPGWYNLGMIAGAQGDTEEARRLIAKARELDPTLPPPGGGR